MRIVRIIWAAAFVLAATVGVHAQEAVPTPADAPNTPAVQTTNPPSANVAPQAEVVPPARAAVAPPVDPTGGMTAPNAERGRDVELGSIDPSKPYKFAVRLTPWGAGLQQVTLTDFYTDTSRNQHYTLVSPLTVDMGGNNELRMYALSAREITINNHTIDLQGVKFDLLNPGDPTSAHYRATVLGPDGGALLQIDRVYRISADSYTLDCEQKLTNLAAGKLKITWRQYGQGDVTSDVGYLGDRRELAGGYHDLDYNPKASYVYTNDLFVYRIDYLNQQAKAPTPFWPNAEVTQNAELVWLSSVNRYFVASLYRPVLGQGDTAKRQPLSDVFPVVNHVTLGPSDKPDKQVMAFTMEAAPIVLEPGQDTGSTLDLSVYMGPRERKTFSSEPYSTLQLDHLLVYRLGCTWCTFQFLARFLLWFLRLIEGDIINIGGMGIGLYDWGLSIIVLVLVVRLILHPLTKKSQIRMAKVSRQMKALQPELAKLKQKYKDDQQAYSREMMRLYRERQVSPFNMLGCAPMFLQMPIWAALYAMLYYAIELRQQPAFYGLFQHLGDLVGINWQFLADLSQPDHFLTLSAEPLAYTFFFITMDFQYINILPLLMGVTFFFQQRMTMSTNMGGKSDEPKTDQQLQQEQMQKTMMWMMPILFPLMMYSTPSGLTLYIMASTLGGIIDSYYVRKHIREEEAAGTLMENKPKEPPKPGSLQWRVQQWSQGIIARVNEAQQQQQQQRPKPGGTREDRPRRGR